MSKFYNESCFKKRSVCKSSHALFDLLSGINLRTLNITTIFVYNGIITYNAIIIILYVYNIYISS